MKAWSEPRKRQSERIKDLADIVRLVEAHPHLWNNLTDDLGDLKEHPRGLLEMSGDENIRDIRKVEELEYA